MKYIIMDATIRVKMYVINDFLVGFRSASQEPVTNKKQNSSMVSQAFNVASKMVASIRKVDSNIKLGIAIT